VNYGCNRVRFPSPLSVGAAVRMRATIATTTRTSSGIELGIAVVFETEHSPKPVCAAEVVIRYLATDPA
jgi:acyl dehydratase